MAITRVGNLVTNGSAINGGNVTIAMPEGMQEGDLAIVFGGHPHRDATPLGPSTSGYTPLHTHTAAGPNVGVWSKEMGASPDTDVVLQGSGHADDGTAYVGYVLRGGAGELEHIACTFAGPTTSTNPDPPAITPVADGTCIISFAASQVNDSTVGSPVGFSEQVLNAANDVNDITSAGALLLNQPGGVEVDPPVWGATVASWSIGENYRITVAVGPAAPVVEPSNPSNLLTRRRRR